ncbi:PREDICTED: uncharacterized protein LOC109117257 [Tarenaya hassleriana]|uniref:uncharacterized protein LOC109117257 n=1 Tax=Tarenaya hassleriana TaxID=28532 RepID=UPI0008FD3192|nr:PREDICTED: uncharacterized protein LOC109117257 [Tarenaya hassleriana]
MSTQSLERLQFRRWGKRIASSTTSTPENAEERAVAFTCCRTSNLLKQLLWRLKSRLRSQKTSNINVQCGYDLRSYHLNFDDGFSRRR